MIQENLNTGDKKKLTNKIALVTGGGRGIGRAIAERLAAEGAIVAITYNGSKLAADEFVASVQNNGGKAIALQADLVNADLIPNLFERLDKELVELTGNNKLDILVNNAGNSGWGGFTDSTPESWDTMFAVHARAPFFIAQSALSRFNNGGRIINISSGLSTRPLPAVPVYSMAKAAINNLTHTLAMEYGNRGITVNAVAPGWTKTDMNAAVRENSDMVQAIEKDTALGRFADPSEIASVVGFLSSEEGKWVTGQIIEASGGYRL